MLVYSDCSACGVKFETWERAQLCTDCDELYEVKNGRATPRGVHFPSSHVPTRFNVINATLGFKGFLWLVSQGDQVHVVNACSNYDAAEACGWSFASCNVQELELALKR